MAVDTRADQPSRRRDRLQKRTFVGLQFRFTVLILSLACCAITLVGGVLVNLAGQLANRHRRDQCLQLASLLAKSAADALQQGDTEELQALSERFGIEDGPVFVALTDPSGRIVAAADASGQRPEELPEPATVDGEQILGVPALVEASPGWDAHLQVTYPINAAQADDRGARPLLGYARVGVDVHNTMGDLTAAIDLFTGISVALLVLIFPLAYLVMYRVVLPLNDLARTVRRFAQGDRQARSSVRRNDEIGELAAAFNVMTDELNRKHQEIVALNVDLEERVQRRTKQLRELASHEPLTGLYNRRHFGDVLANRFSEAVRYSTDLSCMMLDLDDLKSVNDQFGHQTGDKVLILAAITIAGQLRGADLAARYGGDEFVVLLPQTDADRAQVLAERIAEKFALDLVQQLPQLETGLSIGVVSLAEGRYETREDLIRAADEAMYDAKARGKSRIVMSGAVA